MLTASKKYIKQGYILILVKYGIYTDFMHKIFGGEDISINHYFAHRRISIKNYEIIYLQVI
jgi:hypothetical protein